MVLHSFLVSLFTLFTLSMVIYGCVWSHRKVFLWLCVKVLVFTFMCLKPRIALNKGQNPSHFLALCTFYTNSVYLPIRTVLVSFYGHVWSCMVMCEGLSMVMYAHN